MAGNEGIDYSAVLADLEARRTQLDAAIAAVKAIMGQPTDGAPPAGPGPGGPSGKAPKPGDYLGLSITDATKKHLTEQRQKVGTKALMEALEAGGLPKQKYTTVYSVLARRERTIGDIINIDGDWGLAEWYPNYQRKAKPPPKAEEPKKKEAKKQTPKKEEKKEPHKEPTPEEHKTAG